MVILKTNNVAKLLFLLSYLVSGATLASSSVSNTLLKDTLNRLSPYVITLSAGPTWTNGGETQTFYLAPSIQKTYTANKNTSTIFDGELFLGIERALRANLQGQLGLAVAATSDASLSGDIWDDADSRFNNFNYKYKIQHTHIAIKGKLLRDIGHVLKPYVSGSVGVGFNQAHNYNSTPTIFAAVPTPNFTSNMTTAFTYTVGLGLQRAINAHWKASAGYEFADWGKSQLGIASGQTLGGGLSLNHLYTNGLQFSLSYCA